jgi:hypothetical protein
MKNIDKKEIEILLEKYFNAETTLAEENILKSYFCGCSIDKSLAKYIPLFVMYDMEIPQNNAPKRTLKRTLIRRILYSSAAIFIGMAIIIGIHKLISSKYEFILNGVTVHNKSMAVSMVQDNLDDFSSIFQTTATNANNCTSNIADAVNPMIEIKL